LLPTRLDDAQKLFTLDDGLERQTSLTEGQLALLTSQVVVPAQPYSAVTADGAITPIMAFALDRYGTLRPVGLGGIITADGPIGIQRPDGKVEVQGGGVYDNVEAFVAYASTALAA
jgi:hypothetical protein